MARNAWNGGTPLLAIAAVFAFLPEAAGRDIYVADGSETALAVTSSGEEVLVAAFNAAWEFDPDLPLAVSDDGNRIWEPGTFPVGSGIYTGPPTGPWAVAGNAPGELFLLLIRRAQLSGKSSSILGRSTNGGTSFELLHQVDRDGFQDGAMFDVDRPESLGGGAGSANDGRVYLCHDGFGTDGTYQGSWLMTLAPSGALVKETQLSGRGTPPFRGSGFGPVAGVDDGTAYLLSVSCGATCATRMAFFHQVTGGGQTVAYALSSLEWAAAGQHLGSSWYGVNGGRIDHHGTLAIDRSAGPRRGRLYFVSNRNPDPGDPTKDQGDIHLSVSADGARSWSTARVPAQPGKTQFFPMLDVDTRGWIHIAYYQNDAGEKDGGVLEAGEGSIHYALSTDGGATWLGPIPASAPENTLRFEEPPFDLLARGFYLLGDRAAIRASRGGDRVHILWTGYDRLRTDLGPGKRRERVICTTIGIDRFRRGDANGDGVVDLSDGLTVLFALFAGTPPAGDRCDEAIDADGDGSLAVTDAIRILTYLFSGGPAPAEPFPECGIDPAGGDLPCLKPPACP